MYKNGFNKFCCQENFKFKKIYRWLSCKKFFEIFKFVTLILICSMFIGNKVDAAGYKDFPHIFNYAPGAPSNTNHISQTVEVQGNANANAFAKCTSYSYSGNKPVLTVTSASSNYPTNSTSFTGSTSNGQKMKYTVAIPPTNKSVTFRGRVSNYTSFSIAAEVKG